MTTGLPEEFFRHGWCRLPEMPGLADWLQAVRPVARATISDPAHAQWLRYQGTWFAGVNVLPNDRTGATPAGPPLPVELPALLCRELGLAPFDWDPGQLSVCYPGYPQPMAGESEATQRYRVKRDAAHVDGLLHEGPDRRRFLREHHGFILGLPLADITSGMSPFVVWEGSHEIVRDGFRQRFAGIEPADWGREDVTDCYHALRRRIFEECPRVEITARAGQAYLVHRLALHGMAPWTAAPEGERAVLYFRPETNDPEGWLEAV